MSFLDSLENNLKALEGSETSGSDEHKRRESERKRSAAAGPWAEQLKSSPYTQALFQQATRAGYHIRTKINFVWIGNTLRLEARRHRLELRPTAEGILAVYVKGSDESNQQMIDLAGKPESILTGWIAMVEKQKQEEEAMAASQLVEEEG
jgi:hypothetical protein